MLKDCQWIERNGRGPDGEAFNELTLQHASGRIVATVLGPQDQRGGYSHCATFLFEQCLSMHGSPYIFSDFDASKRFIEAFIAENVTEISPGGMITVKRPPRPEIGMIQDALKEALEIFGNRPPIYPPGFPIPAHPIPADAEFSDSCRNHVEPTPAPQTSAE